MTLPANTARGVPGLADLIIGDPAGSSFLYNIDGVWLPNSNAVNVGDPGNPGTGQRFSTAGSAVSLDTFQGTAGVRDVLSMGSGKRVLYLDFEDEAIPVPGPRLISIDEIRMGSGGQIVDLTTPDLSYGDIEIRGGRDGDVIMSNAGTDRLTGNDGNDYLWAGSGNDYADGGNGNDTVFGANGADRLLGGSGNDRVVGGNGLDTIAGGSGNDTVRGGNSDDRLIANELPTAGLDLLYGESGNDRIIVEAGSAVIAAYGGLGWDSISGGRAADLFFGDSGNDTLTGSFGNDSLYGGDGLDQLFGGADNDFINGGNGNDSLDGGDGNDTLLAGDGGSDLLLGGNGDDRLQVGVSFDGTDTLIGGAGSDFYADVLGGPAAYFGIQNVFGTDTIAGFSDVDGDNLNVRLSDWSGPAPTTQATAGASLLIGNGLFTATYASTANAAGTYDLLSLQLAADGLINVAGPVSATTATAAHAQFVFEQSNNTLWFDFDGSGAGQANVLAVFDAAATVASVSGATGTALEASDFFLVNI